MSAFGSLVTRSLGRDDGASRFSITGRPEGDWSELTDGTATEMSATWAPATLACGETYTFRVEAEGDGGTYRDEWGEAATSAAVATAACE